MDYPEYRADFMDTLRNLADSKGTDTEDEFIEKTLEILTDFNEITDPRRIDIGDKKGRNGRNMRINGYSVDETDHSLILFISDFQERENPDKLNMSRINELYWRMYYFLDEACNGNISEYFDESDPDGIIMLSDELKKRLSSDGKEDEFLKIRFIILTNKELESRLYNKNLLGNGNSKSTRKIKKDNFNNKPLDIDPWTLDRFYEIDIANNDEPVIIDIKNNYPELKCSGIPCIKGNIGENLDYEAYIAIIPGKLLAQIYIDYGSKILEGNVRAFLGTKSTKSVNQGIKRTINNEPRNFFTYNNGIAATASDVTIERIDGEYLITNITDLQIINGGQTTATLAETVLKNKNASLEEIFVSMKLTVIHNGETETEDGIPLYNKMISNIARFANSQNKVTAADMFSNEPFHIAMEKMSKKCLAPPAIYNIQTGWYYERSRKKYEQEKMKSNEAEKKAFERKFPKTQKITKEELAKYMTTIDEKPDIVSKGKNWIIKQFNSEISEKMKNNRNIVNEFYFHKCVAAAIIFKAVDNYLEKNKSTARKPTDFWYKAGGYKGNIVPYSIAKLISCIPRGYTINWEKIWKNQSVSSAFMHEIEKLTRITNDFICDSQGIIVTEYCKKKTTWKTFCDEVPYELSKEFLSELVTNSSVAEQERISEKEAKTANAFQEVIRCISKGIDYWKKVRETAIEKGLLSSQEECNLKKLIQMISEGEIPQSRAGNVPTAISEIVRDAKEAVIKLETEGIHI